MSEFQLQIEHSRKYFFKSQLDPIKALLQMSRRLSDITQLKPANRKSSYVGQTIRHLQQCFKEHFGNIKDPLG